MRIASLVPAGTEIACALGFATNGSAYFSRPGPRLVEGVEILAALLHPEVFPTPDRDAAAPVPIPIAPEAII